MGISRGFVSLKLLSHSLSLLLTPSFLYIGEEDTGSEEAENEGKKKKKQQQV